MIELTKIQKTLFTQLRVTNRYFEGEYNIKAVLAITDGLRLHTKNNGKTINIDIIYDYGMDLYKIKAYTINKYNTTFDKIAEFEDVFFDQLHEIIRSILFRKAG
jgi:hypothetical protein